MDQRERPPGWFRPVVWAGLTGATLLIVALLAVAQS